MKLLLFPAIFILLTATSCHKVYDFIHDHPDAHDSLCRVTKISVINVLDHPDTFNITYNEKGDPVSMVSTHTTYVGGNLDQYYRYDRFGRLSDYMLTFMAGTSAIIWHKYAYPRRNYVIDTVINYPPSGDVRDPSPIAADGSYFYLDTYNLDPHGRIVKATYDYNPPYPPVTEVISYDAHGNKVQSDSTLTYDDRINVYRTNKTWQFLYNDYSRNNLVLKYALAVNLYNAFGLPTRLGNPKNQALYLFHLTNVDNYIYISYACSMPTGPINY